VPTGTRTTSGVGLGVGGAAGQRRRALAAADDASARVGRRQIDDRLVAGSTPHHRRLIGGDRLHGLGGLNPRADARVARRRRLRAVGVSRSDAGRVPWTRRVRRLPGRRRRHRPNTLLRSAHTQRFIYTGVPGRRALRSVGTKRLVVPSVRLSTVGSRAFPVAAAQIWNSLPEHIVSAPTLQCFMASLENVFTTTIFLSIALSWTL